MASALAIEFEQFVQRFVRCYWEEVARVRLNLPVTASRANRRPTNFSRKSSAKHRANALKVTLRAMRCVLCEWWMLPVTHGALRFVMATLNGFSLRPRAARYKMTLASISWTKCMHTGLDHFERNIDNASGER